MLPDSWKSMNSSKLQHGHTQRDILINACMYVIRWEHSPLMKFDPWWILHGSANNCL